MNKTLKRLAWAGLILFAPFSVFASIIYVPGDSATIQGAVYGASIGDTIMVNAGTYTENITIDKKISLFGDLNGGTIIDGGGVGDVIHITANRVTVRSLSLKNGGTTQLFHGAWDAGIKIEQADSCVIQFCYIRYNGAAGLSLTASSHNLIANCYFSDNVVGIYFYERIGEEPYLDNFGNKILDNSFVFSTEYGIRFEHTVVSYHHSNIIRGNMFYNNGIGFGLIMSLDNEISYNQFMNNSSVAVSIFICMGGGGDNAIHHNSIVDNGGDSPQAWDTPDCMAGWENLWFSTSDSEGNYWSDYTGSDNDSDGIGDDPYVISENCSACMWGCADWYPLMQPENFDSDYRIDSVDNCPTVSNSVQWDDDRDGVGDACDNCPLRFNPDQADTNGNDVGDICENMCGDPSGNGLINIFDVIFLISYLYLYGPAPHPLESGDPNADYVINIFDITYLISYLYMDGPVPECP